MTFRELINEVLIRLREDTIATDWSGNINDSSTVTDYQKVIGSLINDAKRNIENYHDWLALRETVTVSTASGTKNYNLNSGQQFRVLDVINRDTGVSIHQVSREYMNTLAYPSEASGDPAHYAFNGITSGNLKVDFNPIPNSVQTIAFDIVKPQTELKTASTEMLIPAQPVIIAAWARAISERGEDGGTQASIVSQEAREAINQAIALDRGNVQYETDWYVE